MKTLHFLVPLIALGAPAMAQNVKPCWITDPGNDDIYRCRDLTPDDDYHDAGEIVKVYDAAIGAEPLQNPTGIAAGVDGTMGISDTGEDSLFLLRDFNGDGDAQDPGEFWRFFDGRAGGNLSGIPLNSANSIYYEPTKATWWAANAGAGATPFDTIVAMKDLNGDADANDAGEALVFWTGPVSGNGDYNPMSVHVEPSILGPGPTFASGARVYYSEIGAANTKGVYSVFDLNNDGDGDDAGEWLPYLTPTVVNPAFYWSIDRDANGWFYTADTGNEVVWRFRDNNNDRDAHDLNESFPWYPVGAASNIWDTWAADDGSVYLLESQAPDRLQRLFDADANDVIIPGEIIVAYNDTISPVVFGNPRGIDGDPVPAAGVPYCFGDGSGTACPCSPAPVPDAEAGKGCGNSLFPGGARLETQGTASIMNDTLTVIGRYMPNGACAYFQGTATVGGGLGTTFGDGLRCVGGTVRRFQNQANVDFRSRYPGVGNNPISVAGLVVAPATHMYQGWYRNANSTFCTVETFNLTNAVTVAWSL